MVGHRDTRWGRQTVTEARRGKPDGIPWLTGTRCHLALQAGSGPDLNHRRTPAPREEPENQWQGYEPMDTEEDKHGRG